MLPIIIFCALSARPALPPLAESVFAHVSFPSHLLSPRVAVSPGSDMPPVFIPPSIEVPDVALDWDVR